MAKADAPEMLRLEALPPLLLLLLLLVPYTVCSSSCVKEDSRSQPGSIASKRYAGTDSSRVKLLRPARVQVRLARSYDLSGKGGSDHAKYLGLIRVGLQPSGLFPAVERPLAASAAQPDPFLFRTRNPRDPPLAA